MATLNLRTLIQLIKSDLSAQFSKSAVGFCLSRSHYNVGN